MEVLVNNAYYRSWNDKNEIKWMNVLLRYHDILHYSMVVGILTQTVLLFSALKGRDCQGKI